MLSPEEIVQQQKLLATYRRTLAVYLKQQAEIGRAYSPPALINGIEDTRTNIKRIKEILSAAGIQVPVDPDDEEPPPPPPRPVALPTQDRVFPRWFWPIVAGTLAIALAIGVGWWRLSNPQNGTSSQEQTPVAVETPTKEETPTEEAPTVEIDLSTLESQLADANIALSAVQVENVRDYINKPDTGYKAFAEHALQVVGDRKFRDTIYLDEMEVKYTELVGEEHYIEFNDQRLREAMVEAWNGHYPDQQVTSFDEIVEPRS
jgi:hypothetical protein